MPFCCRLKQPLATAAHDVVSFYPGRIQGAYEFTMGEFIGVSGFNPSKCGSWWLIGRFIAFRPKSRGFESRSSRQVGTLGKSYNRSCHTASVLCRERL